MGLLEIKERSHYKVIGQCPAGEEWGRVSAFAILIEKEREREHTLAYELRTVEQGKQGRLTGGRTFITGLQSDRQMVTARAVWKSALC